MINKELLDILCCPETKQDVLFTEGTIIEKINLAIKNKKLKRRDGTIISEPIDAGLLRADKRFLYPIKENIPIMLINESIDMNQLVDE